MGETYYVASLRGSGWFSRSSQFNSQFTEAKPFTRDEAIKMCRLYKSNGVVCVPVTHSDMDEINDKR